MIRAGTLAETAIVYRRLARASRGGRAKRTISVAASRFCAVGPIAAAA